MTEGSLAVVSMSSFVGRASSELSEGSAFVELEVELEPFAVADRLSSISVKLSLAGIDLGTESLCWGNRNAVTLYCSPSSPKPDLYSSGGQSCIRGLTRLGSRIASDGCCEFCRDDDRSRLACTRTNLRFSDSSSVCGPAKCTL